MDGSDTKSSGRFEDDLGLTRRIIAGSTSAWHEFLETYVDLIYNVIRRHLPTSDDDEVHGVYVHTLEHLYGGGLRNYHGDMALRSWLMLVSRRRSIDYLRARFGRYREPRGVGRLSRFDRAVFQFYHVDRLPIEVVLHSLDWDGHKVSVDDLVDSILRVEKAVGNRTLNKLDDRHAARGNGSVSVAALRYFVQLRVEFEWRVGNNATDDRLIKIETAKRVENVRELLAGLPEEDRRIAKLRFEDHLSASEIAGVLGIKDRRKVYTLVERVKRRLRAALDNA